MKMKYYLRGIGVGIIIATLILCIADGSGTKSSDSELHGETVSTESLYKPTKPTESSAEAATETSSEMDTGEEISIENVEPSEKVTEKEDTTYTEIHIPGGSTSEYVSELLKEAGIISDATEFNNYLRNNGYDRNIQPGNKTIPVGAKQDEIANIICR